MKHCKIIRYLFAAAALFSGLGLGLGGAPQPALALTDLAPTHWAASTINAYVSRGIMAGYPDGTFRPEASVTRAEFVKMVNSVFGYNTTTTINFPDVSATYWGYDEIAKGVYAGYINGDENGYFNPESPLTREEAASIICRIKGLAPNQSAISTYTDSARISTWAAPYVGAATQFGYMQGSGDGSFNPTQALTRAEAASVLSKAEAKTTTSSSNTTSNVTNNNVLSRPGVSTTTSTTKVTDYTMGSSETTLANKTITGDLYIPSGLGSKTVNLDDLVVNGTVYVRGGGTIDVDNCDFNKVVLDKSGVTFITDSKSTVDELEFRRNGRIDGKGYGDVTIADDNVTTATINATVDSLVLDTDANLRLMRNASIDDFEATSNANRATINFASGAYVNEMDLYDHVQITGTGEINRMYTYVSGIYSSIEPNRLTTSGSGTRPTYTTNDDDNSNSGSNGSNGSNGSTNTPGSTTTTVKDLIATSNVNGTTSRGGTTTYDTVTVQKSNITVNNVVVDKSLVIDAAVADGTVTLSHVTVKGPVYIHGGGQNSVIFIDCTLEGNIYIDKKTSTSATQPVALKLNDGTQLKGDIIVSSNAHISTSPKENVLNKITVNGTLTSPLKIDAFVNSLTVENSSALSVELINGVINTITAKDAEVTVKGTGYLNNIDGAPNLNIDMLTPPDENTLPSLPNFKSIIDLSGIATTVEMGEVLDLSKCQAKYSDGTTGSISSVIWSVSAETAKYVTLTDTSLIATPSNPCKFTLTATVKNGSSIGEVVDGEVTSVDYTQDFTITVTDVFIPVTGVTANFPSSVTLKDGETLKISLNSSEYGVTLAPANATHSDIRWTVSGSGAKIEDNTLLISEAGSVRLTATVDNGLGTGRPYTTSFTINATAPYCPVGEIVLKDLKYETEKATIDGVEQEIKVYQAYAGSNIVLNTTITPPADREGARPTYTAVTWSLVNDGNTGVTENDLRGTLPTLKPTSTGEIRLKAVVNNGANEGKDNYEQLIFIKVNAALIGDIEISPTPISGQNSYYRGQTIRLSVDSKTMAAYKENLIWSISNEDELGIYISADKMPKLDTETNPYMPLLTIPEDFPYTENLNIVIEVANSNDRTASKTNQIIVLGDFISVAEIRNSDLKVTTDQDNAETVKTLEIPMTGGVDHATYDLSKFTVYPTNAICKDIVWSVPEDSGARIEDGQLVVTKPGQFALTATIENGVFIGEGYNKDFKPYVEQFEIDVLVPPIGPITAETTPLASTTSYYSGQKVTFSMDASILKEHGDKIEWSNTATNETDADKNTGKYTITIPTDFSGKLTVTAKNGEDKATTEINVTAFTPIDAGAIKINVPTNAVKVGGTATISCTGITLSDGQSIEWSADGYKGSEPIFSTTNNKYSAEIKIGTDETATSINIIATIVNGSLDVENNKLTNVDSDPQPITIDLGKVSNIKVTPESITETDYTYYVGQIITLEANISAANYGTVKWNIVNEDEIGDNAFGSDEVPKLSSTSGQSTKLTIPAKFPAEKIKTIKISASVNGVEIENPIEINVSPFTAVSGLTITATDNIKQAEQGATVGFTANYNSTEATDKTVIWTVKSNKSTILSTIDEKTGELSINENETVGATLTVTATINHGTISSAGAIQPATKTYTITVIKKTTDAEETTSTLSLRNPNATSNTSSQEQPSSSNKPSSGNSNNTNSTNAPLSVSSGQADRIAEKNNQAQSSSSTGVKKYSVSAD